MLVCHSMATMVLNCGAMYGRCVCVVRAVMVDSCSCIPPVILHWGVCGPQCAGWSVHAPKALCVAHCVCITTPARTKNNPTRISADFLTWVNQQQPRLHGPQLCGVYHRAPVQWPLQAHWHMHSMHIGSSAQCCCVISQECQ